MKSIYINSMNNQTKFLFILLQSKLFFQKNKSMEKLMIPHLNVYTNYIFPKIEIKYKL